MKTKLRLGKSVKSKVYYTGCELVIRPVRNLVYNSEYCLLWNSAYWSSRDSINNTTRWEINL